MWLGLAVLVVAVAAAIGGAFAGGIFTIVLIPLAGLALIGALIGWMWGRATGGAGVGTTTEPTESGGRMSANSLPRTRGSSGAHAPASPERVADLRREQQ
ncbi:MAG TPA: hypothetical protein VG410_14845 [Solirubrobacteraceae bacterium]|jgi:hypothetical protein|nr:hypothetical protein [Solirubrobacteraceae bacterium]